MNTSISLFDTIPEHLIVNHIAPKLIDHKAPIDQFMSSGFSQANRQSRRITINLAIQILDPVFEPSLQKKPEHTPAWSAEVVNQADVYISKIFLTSLQNKKLSAGYANTKRRAIKHIKDAWVFLKKWLDTIHTPNSLSNLSQYNIQTLQQVYHIIRSFLPPLPFREWYVLSKISANKKSLQICRDRILQAQESQSESLDLSNLGLHALPKELFLTTNLKHLLLNNNFLKSIPTDICQLTNLTTLTMESNQLTTLPHSINLSENLEALNLSQNSIFKFPDMILKITPLKILDLGNNKLKNIPAEIEKLYQQEQNKLLTRSYYKYSRVKNHRYPRQLSD